MEHREQLAQTSVDRRQIHGIEQHAQPADQRLQKTTSATANQPSRRSQRRSSQRHKAAGEPERERAHHSRAQAVRVLGEHRDVLKPAGRIERAIGERPVRKDHARADAGCQRSQQDEHEDPASGNGGEPCQHRTITGYTSDADWFRHASISWGTEALQLTGRIF